MMHLSDVAVEKGIIGKLFGTERAADIWWLLGFRFDKPRQGCRGVDVCTRQIDETVAVLQGGDNYLAKYFTFT